MVNITSVQAKLNGSTYVIIEIIIDCILLTHANIIYIITSSTSGESTF